jgi:membrane-bound lytic murein transglycosylase D
VQDILCRGRAAADEQFRHARGSTVIVLPSLLPSPGPRAARLGLLLLTLLLVASSGARAQAKNHPSLDARHFPLPVSLVPNVEFWRAIFSRYDSDQTVIHDNRHLDVIFTVVDTSDLLRSGQSAVAIERAAQGRVDRAIARYQQALRRLGGDTRADADPADLERIRGLYAASSRQPRDFSDAAARVRGQRGLKDRFAEAIETSGLFMPEIERILARHGLPREIRCLPFVESMFNYRARSKVGASGVWQFTADTGRRYLRIDQAVDARHDVFLAADAAARMLADHHRRVGSWPLALTGYNHGIAGMERARRQLGTTDIGTIADRYVSPTFGFASRNFYAEFLAAVTVFADRATLFPDAAPRPPLVFDEFVPRRFVSLLDLAHLTGTTADALADLNPALHDDVARGVMLIPSGYPLRVPRGTGPEFQQAFARLPAARTPDSQPGRTHRVARGETLSGLARRYGTTVARLRASNGLSARSALRAGQVLTVGHGSAWSPLVWTPPAATAVATRMAAAAPVDRDRTHVVRSGETLYQIASRYGLTVAAVVAANQIVSPDRLIVGMQLTIPITAKP